MDVNTFTGDAVITNPIWYDIAYNTAVTEAEHKSKCKPIKNSPYLALMGKGWLWVSIVYILEQNDRVLKAPHCIRLCY